MGIDIYLRWDGMTEEEKEARDRCEMGYLRESYDFGSYIAVEMGSDQEIEINGEDEDGEKAFLRQVEAHMKVVARGDVFHHAADDTPYATKLLVPEAFTSPNREAEIAARELRARLPGALQAIRKRRHHHPGIALAWEQIAKEKQAKEKQFREFVELAEKKEVETRALCTVIADY